jgi:predicted  nucleic acid-binding Zn-ribbon protein
MFANRSAYAGLSHFRRAKMLNILITENEVFTLGNSFQNFIEKMKKNCPGCKIADTAREYAVIENDDEVIAIKSTINDFARRLDRADSLTKTDTP